MPTESQKETTPDEAAAAAPVDPVCTLRTNVHVVRKGKLIIHPAGTRLPSSRFTAEELADLERRGALTRLSEA